MVATALARDDSGQAERTLGAATRLSLLCGLASAALQIAFGARILATYTDASSRALVNPAARYVAIRALGAPAALLAKVSTAACLAMKDALSPLLALTLSGVLNLVLDVALVPALGIGGAAWATLAAELFGAALIASAASRRLAPTSAPRRFRLHKVSAWAPRRAEASAFGEFARPLLVVTVGKIATYSALAHVATTMGVASVAAHRVLMCVYWFCWPFGEVVSQVCAGARTSQPCARHGRDHTRSSLAILCACAVRRWARRSFPPRWCAGAARPAAAVRHSSAGYWARARRSARRARRPRALFSTCADLHQTLR